MEKIFLETIKRIDSEKYILLVRLVEDLLKFFQMELLGDVR